MRPKSCTCEDIERCAVCRHRERERRRRYGLPRLAPRQARNRRKGTKAA